MSLLKKLLAYPLIAFGIMFLTVAIGELSNVNAEKSEMPETIAICLIYSTVSFAVGGGLLWSAKSK
jgi:ammonia channel protein AmtB